MGPTKAQKKNARCRIVVVSCHFILVRESIISDGRMSTKRPCQRYILFLGSTSTKWIQILHPIELQDDKYKYVSNESDFINILAGLNNKMPQKPTFRSLSLVGLHCII
jgi:hypothetical protein